MQNGITKKAAALLMQTSGPRWCGSFLPVDSLPAVGILFCDRREEVNIQRLRTGLWRVPTKHSCFW